MKNEIIIDLVENLSDYHTEMVIRSIIDLMDLQVQDENTYPKSCPNCASSSGKFIKKGVNSR